MSFWNSDIGDVTGEPQDAFAKSFVIVPDGTKACASIESMANVSFNGYDYIAIEWVLGNGDFKGAKINQKLKVFDNDPKVRHRSLNMLKLLYLMFGLKPKHTDAPTDNDLAVFIGKEAGIIVRETEPNAEGKQYNWVSEVHPVKDFKSETGVHVQVTRAPSAVESALTRNPRGIDVMDEELPF